MDSIQIYDKDKVRQKSNSYDPTRVINLMPNKINTYNYSLIWLRYILFILKSTLHLTSNNYHPLFGLKSMGRNSIALYLKSNPNKALYNLSPLGFSKKINRSIRSKTLPLSIFNFFINFTIYPHGSRFEIHSSWRTFFMTKKLGGVMHINAYSLFHNWGRVYNLLFNFFYFNLKCLFFGNNFFKTEVESLNWVELLQTKTLFRYVSPFLTYQVSRIINEGWLIFKKLKLKGFNTTIIIDLFFHKKTLFYLNRVNIYTIALVPMNYNQSLVDVALPAASDSFLSQLIFIRLILNLKRSIAVRKYTDAYKLWGQFKFL